MDQEPDWDMRTVAGGEVILAAEGFWTVGTVADYFLKTEFREFQAEFSERLPQNSEGGIRDIVPPTIRVRLNAKLIKMPRRSIVASKKFEYLIDAKENSMEGILGAIDAALGKTMRRMVVDGWREERRSTRQGRASAAIIRLFERESQ